MESARHNRTTAAVHQTHAKCKRRHSSLSSDSSSLERVKCSRKRKSHGSSRDRSEKVTHDRRSRCTAEISSDIIISSSRRSNSSSSHRSSSSSSSSSSSNKSDSSNDKQKRRKRKRKYSSSAGSSNLDERRASEPKKKKKHKSKQKKKKHSHNTSASYHSSDNKKAAKESRKKRKKREKLKRKEKKKEKKKSLKQVGKEQTHPHPLPNIPLVKSNVPQVAPPTAPEIEEAERARKVRAPMTKEEYDKQQSIVRRMYDPETGRSRLVRGEGEIIEEIVSRERHKEINRQATRGDGMSFQMGLGLHKYC
ncbi:PREDICTED: ADP-ribosylation factor-like protein 6-interacting protein 4 [Priapulus caudatus]|uniref:ADP-ribosylation factor-like protein 6-interacting protein 4 n=1 Tax=Priapulus caudatus TaxID=37621 RepID=A0ABM1F0Q2_PRICU|nr:PREDICTED: ADP-ribosylation factor-like protein 6-interacting protein 4 [Priapulus caudatus]XP_014678023.1 PREDICTED: ADP-ribosylation factor-like protein 6-interacting protein 4 [Priapulus caudatus]XP_014678029.1 PREDICTED: ADP-ribosylation factor-like protein 6-interacting protein 4 [Priapulus caudatus]